MDEILMIHSCDVENCVVVWFKNRHTIHSSHDPSISEYSCYPSLRG